MSQAFKLYRKCRMVLQSIVSIDGGLPVDQYLDRIPQATLSDLLIVGSDESLLVQRYRGTQAVIERQAVAGA